MQTTPPSTSGGDQLPGVLAQTPGSLVDPAARSRDGSQPYYPQGTGPFFSNRESRRRNARPSGSERRKKMILQAHFAKRKRRFLAGLDHEFRRGKMTGSGEPISPQAPAPKTDLTPAYWEETL